MLAETLHEGMALLAEVVRAPAFPKRELERVRAETLDALQARDDEPANVADDSLAAAIFGFTAVLLGAIGAHAVSKRVGPHDLETWKTAAQYHGLHAMALLALAAWGDGGRLVAAAARCLGAGMIVFSGSLYLLVLSLADVGLPPAKWLGAVTPVGGVLLMAGWGLIGVAAWKKK
jgi:uncharacterized membrane protein YgdD (TMEM256/DUF423 family)